MKKTAVVRYEYLGRGSKITLLIISWIMNIIVGIVIGVMLADHSNPDLHLPEKLLEKLNPPIVEPEIETKAKKISSDEFDANRWSYKTLKKETICLADNIYHEGRGQDVKGQIAIGLTTINRVKSKYFPDSICKVVWEKRKDRKSGKYIAMFSWTLDGKTDKIHSKKVYKEIELLAEAMIAEGTLDNFFDFTEGATHYHNTSVSPYWAPSMVRIAQIDKHIFYKR